MYTSSPSPFCRCSFIGMVFQGKCVVLSELFFCPPMFRQIRAIFCVLTPSFKNRLAMTILCTFGFSQHIPCFVVHCLTQWWTMPGTSGLVLLHYVSRNRQYVKTVFVRLLSVGCMHFPRVQFSIRISHHEAQSGHCLFEEVSLNSKMSVSPISVIKSFDS